MHIIHQSYGVLQCLKSEDFLSTLDSEKMALPDRTQISIYIDVESNLLI